MHADYQLASGQMFPLCTGQTHPCITFVMSYNRFDKHEDVMKLDLFEQWWPSIQVPHKLSLDYTSQE